MNKKIFSEIKEKINRLVSAHRLREAFSEARSLAETMMSFEDSDALARAEDTYRQMLAYASSGAEDPARQEMSQQLGETILSVTDVLERRNLMTDEPTLYYNTARFEKIRPQESIAWLLDEYRKVSGSGSMFDLIAGSAKQEEYTRNLQKRQNLESRLFNKIWATHPLRGADAEAIEKIFTSGIYPSYFAILIVWAITLGALTYYDQRRLELLMVARMTDGDKLQAAALVGLLLALNKARGRYMPPRVRNRLEALKETPGWETDTEAAYMELVRTRDTDRITAKIRDEVVPEMMKLRPEITRRFQGELPVDAESLEENPEWQEILDKSGVSDKLKEMSEIQEEGGDVMMGTFVHLKSFPFFHEVANWFLPFHTERTELAGESCSDIRPLADIISAMPMLCDSDKFSMMLSMVMSPAAQREMLLKQLNAQADQLQEMRAAMLNTAVTDRRDLLRKQVQNLFRFFRIFRRKGEFPNPFAAPVNLSDIAGLESLSRPDLVALICEFYFSHGYYEDGVTMALGLGDFINSPSEHQTVLLQRMGFACMKLGRFSEAIGYFERVLLLEPDNIWVLKNLSRCYMQTGDYTRALQYLQEITKLPAYKDDPALTLQIAHCRLELGEYDTAVKSYFKAEYLGVKPRKVLRQLSWALLMNGDPVQSRRYLEKAMEKTGTIPNDYLNLGHINLVEKKLKDALNSYRLNILSRKDADRLTLQEASARFIADLKEDEPSLRHIGIDTSLLPLLTDSLLYSL